MTESDSNERIVGVREDGALVVMENYDDVISGSALLMQACRSMNLPVRYAWDWVNSYVSANMRIRITW